MEVDQFVATEPGETDQPATEEQSVPDQFTAVAQVDTDSSIVAQDEGCHTVTGLADGQFVSEDQSESVQLMSVDHSVNDKFESVLQSETDQPMEIDVSGNDPYVVEDQGGNSQPATGEQCVVEQLEVSPVETDQSIVKVQDEACQLLTVIADEGETGQLVSVEQIGSHDLEAVDNSGNYHFVAAGQDKTGPSVTEDQIINDQFVTDGQFETVNLVVKSQDSIQTEHGLANEGELISEDQSESHELMVVDSGKDQSLTSDHIFTPYDAVAREELLKELCNIKFFSIVTEEEFAIDGQPYISVGIHYLNKQDIMCENMLAFIPLSTNITSFVDTLTIALSEKWGLNLALCRSQNLARPGATVSQMTQASALLSQRLPHAFSFPNLVTPKSLLDSLSSLREITHCFECLEQLFMWFSEDIQRRVRLEDAVVHMFQEDERKASELKAKISSNQLAMSHEVLELTTDILEAIVFCLNEMKGNQDNEANTAQAQSFLSDIQNFDFILTVVIMKNILSLTKSISLSLQGNSYDVYQAVNRVSDLMPSLSEMKNSIDSHHQTWFQEAVALASKQVPSLQPPLNVHYREDISKGAIEHCIAEMEGLSQDVLSAVRCLQVVPYVMSKVEGCCNDTEFVKVFQDVLPDPNSFQDELQRWRDRWQDCIASHQHLPDTVLGTLKTSDIETFPNISTILRLLASVPVSLCVLQCLICLQFYLDEWIFL
uniref:Uncharacterized protein n=1 Tax=Sinocyclocheilus rhinocerous TaxID=307959 RepID=A0A673MND0_9TELE